MGLRKISERGWMLAALLGTMLMAQGCLKNDVVETYDFYGFLQKDFATLNNYITENGIDAEVDSLNGIFYKIHKKGDGYKTVRGINVSAHYQGFTLDGNEFASTFDGDPIDFVFDDETTFVTSMTNGVSNSLWYLQEGDSATFYFPSPYGFQDQSYQDVPPNSILVYTISFVDIKNLDEEYVKIDQYIADNNMSATVEPKYGIRYAIHRAGNNISPEAGASISLDYQGELLDGTVFDSSYDRGSPFDFTYGSGGSIVGFEMGVAQLHENDSATIFIPSIYGYGDEAKEDIPANSALIFGLDMLRISNPL